MSDDKLKDLETRLEKLQAKYDDAVQTLSAAQSDVDQISDKIVELDVAKRKHLEAQQQLNPTTLPLQSVSYVPRSFLFDGCETLWDEMSEMDVDFTWGDNSHSLISYDLFVDCWLDEYEISADDDEDTAEIRKELTVLLKRLDLMKPFKDHICIDLEN